MTDLPAATKDEPTLAEILGAALLLVHDGQVHGGLNGCYAAPPLGGAKLVSNRNPNSLFGRRSQ